MKTLAVLIAFFAAGLLALAGCTAEATGSPAAPHRKFTLRTGIVDGRLAYVGVGGDIDGLANPDLVVQSGDIVHIDLLNGDGVAHDVAVASLGAQTPMGLAKDQTVSMTFKAGKSGVYRYICTVPGHRQAGMEGRLVITPSS